MEKSDKIYNLKFKILLTETLLSIALVDNYNHAGVVYLLVQSVVKIPKRK